MRDDGAQIEKPLSLSLSFCYVMCRTFLRRQQFIKEDI